MKLPIRIAAYANGLAQLNDDLDLRLSFQAQFQSVYREYLGLIGVKLHLNRRRGKEFALVPTMGLRFNDFSDAWFPMLEFHHRNQLRVSLSYDVNISDFQLATNQRGGLELGLRYLFKKVCPIPKVKFCPPFI
ncbi:MAG: type IX secretion system membrane protein PorP/SprF [Bacteroidetes bacterium]|nr:MAG: type IX secretion system membrane protein PorP/SprF [Bacteroidota bacterium]